MSHVKGGRRWRALPLTAALALLTSLVPATALVAAVPGTALAASPGQQEVYVLAFDPLTGAPRLTALSAANPATQIFQLGGADGLGTGNQAAVVSPDSSAVYVGTTSSPVIPVDTLQQKVGEPFKQTFFGFGFMAMSPDGSTLYIPAGIGVTEYHPATGVLTQNAITVPGAQGLWGIAVSPDGSTLYVADNGGNDVHVIDIATKSVTSTIPLGNAPNTVLLSPDGSRLYVLEAKADTVAVIDTASDTVTTSITIPHPAANMNSTDSSCISPDGSTLFVPGSPGQPLQVISTATDTITSTISNPAGNQNELNCADVRPDGGQPETVDERREPPDDRQAGDRDRRRRAAGVGARTGQLGDSDHAGGGRHQFGGRPGRLPAHLGVHPDRGLPAACSGHLDHQVPGIQQAGNRGEGECAVPARRPEIGVPGRELVGQVRLLPGQHRLRLAG